jgi:hypothetical protein
LLPEHGCLLSGYLARAVNHVCPAIAEVSESRKLAAVVPSHVSPLLRRRVVSKPPVQLDVHAVLRDEHVEILRTVTESSPLPLALRKPVLPAQSGVAELEWGVGARGHVGQRLEHYPPPARLGEILDQAAKAVGVRLPSADRGCDEAECRIRRAPGGEEIDNSSLDPSAPRGQGRMDVAPAPQANLWVAAGRPHRFVKGYG